MYLCPYATVNKAGFACEYRDEAVDANRDLKRMDELRGNKTFIKPLEPICPGDVKRDDYGSAICYKV